jgi:catechol 2,3-dioxygenase-like lactoylglutathione lyase family enzyme
MAIVHHTAVRVRNVEESLRFWRDGLGFDVLMDHEFDGDWTTLLRASSNSLRSLFLGSAEDRDSGILELVDLGEVEPPPPAAAIPTAGFLLVSIMTDVDAALGRLEALGLGGPPRRIEVAGVAISTVVDPDGVVVELVESSASANLNRLKA